MVTLTTFQGHMVNFLFATHILQLLSRYESLCGYRLLNDKYQDILSQIFRVLVHFLMSFFSFFLVTFMPQNMVSSITGELHRIFKWEVTKGLPVYKYRSSWKTVPQMSSIV